MKKVVGKWKGECFLVNDVLSRDCRSRYLSVMTMYKAVKLLTVESRYSHLYLKCNRVTICR